MNSTRKWSNFVTLAAMTAATLAFCGGCTPIDGGELGTFLTETMRNAAAAFLF